MNLFPFDSYRNQQQELVTRVRQAIKTESLLLQAPTGVGKTAGVLTPAIEEAIETDKQVWFLTNRSSQHQIVVDTVKKIRTKHGLSLFSTDLIGKSTLCLYRDESHCKTKRLCGNDLPSFSLTEINESNMSASELQRWGKRQNICPYLISLRNLCQSRVVIADYYHLFSPDIRTNLLKSSNRDLSDIILVVDEAHNLPQRLRSMLSISLTTKTLRRAFSQSFRTKFGNANELFAFSSLLEELCSSERTLSFTEVVQDKTELVLLLRSLTELFLDEGENLYETDALLQVQRFLEKLLSDLDYAIQTHKGKITLLCLDATHIARQVFDSVSAYVAMSATLPSPDASRRLLSSIAPYYSSASPFPAENLKTILVTGISSRYRDRNKEMYRRYATLFNHYSETLKGNMLAFFTSYGFRDNVLEYASLNRTILLERQHDSASKTESLRLFSELDNSVLCASINGSFSEGIDLPINSLSSVLIFGLPLPRPTLESKELMKRYDKQYDKGYEYAYQIPAMTKVIQATGRLIRHEDQKGTIVLLDDRYTYPQYRALMPTSWNPLVE